MQVMRGEKHVPKRPSFITANMTFLASDASILGPGMWSTPQHLLTLGAIN